MALTIRERNQRYGSWATPLPLDLPELEGVEAVPVVSTTVPVRLGFEGEPSSQVFSFQLPVRSSLAVLRTSANNDPLIVHASVSLVGPMPARAGRQLVNSADGASEPLELEPGDYRIVVACMLPIILEVRLKVSISPIPVQVRAGVGAAMGAESETPLTRFGSWVRVPVQTRVGIGAAGPGPWSTGMTRFGSRVLSIRSIWIDANTWLPIDGSGSPVAGSGGTFVWLPTGGWTWVPRTARVGSYGAAGTSWPTPYSTYGSRVRAFETLWV